jgi:uncharacterized protein (TIGR04222 family)
MSLAPYDLTGVPLLYFYLSLLAVAVGAGLLIPDFLRPEGRIYRATNPDELAYLAGGRRRFSQTVTARLLAAGALILSSRKLFYISSPEKAESPAERKVMRLSSPASWADIVRVLDDHAGSLEDRLVSAGLLMSSKADFRLRAWSVLPYVMLLLLGTAGAIAEAMRGQEIANLVLFMILTIVLALVRWIRFDPSTRAGRAALLQARRQAERLRVAPTRPEVGIAVALYGPLVLSGSAWAEFDKPAPRRDKDGGGCGGGGGCGAPSGCGGGGGCGGGCGG